MGVSLKMYFGHAHTLEWCQRVAELAGHHPALRRGLVDLAVLPSFPSLPEAVEILGRANIAVGAQDLCFEDYGPFTGEVGGPELREIGCRFVEVGHAERRSLFGETDAIIAGKVAAALRNQLTPIVCVGETTFMPLEDAAERCVAQLEAALQAVPQGTAPTPSKSAGVVVAYEPVWAIGASAPAAPAHIRGVCAAIQGWAAQAPALAGARVIYGGSAGQGLLSQLGGAVDGLFLGRSAHDPERLEGVLSEVLERASKA